MFATPPRGLKVIKVSKVCCERRYAAQSEYRRVFQWPMHWGISGPETFLTYSVGRENRNKTTRAISVHYKKRPQKSMPAASLSCQFQWASLGATGRCGNCTHPPPFFYSIPPPLFEGQGRDAK